MAAPTPVETTIGWILVRYCLIIVMCLKQPATAVAAHFILSAETVSPDRPETVRFSFLFRRDFTACKVGDPDFSR